MVKSTQAKNKINQWFKKELKEDNILKGKEMLAQYAKSKGFKFANYAKPQYIGGRFFTSMASVIGIPCWRPLDMAA